MPENVAAESDDEADEETQTAYEKLLSTMGSGAENDSEDDESEEEEGDEDIEEGSVNSDEGYFVKKKKKRIPLLSI